jgi:hypothetical protein
MNALLAEGPTPAWFSLLDPSYISAYMLFPRETPQDVQLFGMMPGSVAGPQIFRTRVQRTVAGHQFQDIAMKDGWVNVPQAPGLGVTLNEAAISRYRY